MRLRRVCGLALAVCGIASAGPAFGASHREAPITALDRSADITDYFSFVSYDKANSGNVTFILNVDPLLDPANGPNWFPFDPNILYEIKIDNDNNAIEDIVFQFRFQTTINAPGVFQGLVGAGGGINAPANSPAPVAPGSPVVPPAITSLTGAGAAGFNLEQTYTVTMLKRKPSHARNALALQQPYEVAPQQFEKVDLSAGQTLIALPTNVGPRTMPNYPALFSQAIFPLHNGVTVFAGTVEDPFYIDLGAAFDTLNLRSSAFTSGTPGVLTDAQDADDFHNITADNVSGYNVNSIAIQVPITMLTTTGAAVAATDTNATIGSWGTTSRPRISVRRFVPFNSRRHDQDDLFFQFSGGYRQIQRMGNPLINELIIGTGSKDRWSMSHPKDDADFASFALDPLLARVINAAYGGAVQIPPPPRTDLLPLLEYLPPIAAANTPKGPVADLLRLNLGVPATLQPNQHRLGLLAHDASGNATPDAAGWPNGRRPIDDVTDVALRAVAGALTGTAPFNAAPNTRLGDGVNVDDVQPYPSTFPFLSPALSGRDSRHIDPGEPNGGPVN